MSIFDDNEGKTFYYIKYEDKDTGEIIYHNEHCEETYADYDYAVQDVEMLEDEGHNNVEIWMFICNSEELEKRVYPMELQP